MSPIEKWLKTLFLPLTIVKPNLFYKFSQVSFQSTFKILFKATDGTTKSLMNGEMRLNDSKIPHIWNQLQNASIWSEENCSKWALDNGARLMEDKRFPIPVRGFLISWNFINLMGTSS